MKNDMKRTVTFGELMLRMPEAGIRVEDLNYDEARFGGSEANVAVSLATLGDEVSYVTRLPDNAAGHAASDRISHYGVNTDLVLFHGNKIGSYFLQQGASRQKSKTVYDRYDTAYSTLKPGDIDWHSILKDASVFHTSGICAAISQSAADAVFEALDVADELGVTVSFDINYRKNLWEYGADARETLTRMMQRADIMFGDVLEYEFICNNEPIPFRTANGEAPDREAYAQWFEQLHELCPRCGHMIIGVRNQVSPTHHELTALMLANEKMYVSKVQDITPVIDPVGVGDAFAAGSIHAALNFPDDNQRWVDYALAAATLKNRVRGDFPLTTDPEILELVDDGKSYTAEQE